MAEQPRADNGSPERVALELANQIAGWENSTTSNDKIYTRKAFLDLYAECLRAARSLRSAPPAT